MNFKYGLKNLNKQNKQAIMLYFATFSGIGLGMLSSVINTRNLSPADYGDFKYIENIIGFISGFLLFGYFISGARLLALSENKLHSSRLRGGMVAILFIAIVVLIITLLITYFIHHDILKNPVAPLFLISLPVSSVMLMKGYLNTTAIGDNQIGRIALTRVLPSAIYVVIAYFVFNKFGATSARMLLLHNGIAVFIFFLIIVSTKPSFVNLRNSLKSLSLENKTYGFHVYLGSIVGVGFSYLAGITLGLYNTNNTEVGFYSLALTLTAPLLMLPKSIGSSYYKKFSTIQRIPTKVLKMSIAITLIGFLGFVTLIYPVVGFLYDVSYSVVARYASFLAFATSIHGFGDLITQYLGSQGLGKQIKKGAIISGAVLLFGYIVLVYFFGIIGAIITKIIGSTVYCTFMLIKYKQYTRGISKV